MLLPTAKITTGLWAVANIGTARFESYGCFRPTASFTRAYPPVSGTSLGMTPMLATPSVSGATLVDVIITIRAGAKSGPAVDFTRETLTLQGMASYGTITALIMNASLRLWTSTDFAKNQSNIVRNIFNISTALCIMSGAFTAILFQLLIIYSKSALGMGNDEGYVAFKAATSTFRMWGFRCFLIEMMSFVVCFMSKLYNRLWKDARKLQGDEYKSALTTTGRFIIGGSVILMAIGSVLIRSVVNLASKHVFSTGFNEF